MENSSVLQENSNNLPSTDVSERPTHLFQPGQSGNPKGRPKKSEREKQLMEDLKALIPDCVETIKNILDPKQRVPAVARVRMVEIVLAYVLGKPESNVKLTTSSEQSIEAAERIETIVRAIKINN